MITTTKQQLERYPQYLRYLKALKNEGVEKVSAANLTKAVNCTEDQVRKDFQAINIEKGKPNNQRTVQSYIDCIETFLGYRNSQDAFLVGVGNLGKALLNYNGFDKYGIKILAGFDKDAEMIGQTINGKIIFPIDKMENLVARMKVRIGIITVSDEDAQRVADLMINSGIKAIWNFAPIHLNVPEGIIVENMDLAASLSMLSYRLEANDKKEKTDD